MPLDRVPGQLFGALVDHPDGRRGRSFLREAKGGKLGTLVDREGLTTPARTVVGKNVFRESPPGVLKADVLKVPHHGSETASTSAFLAKVRPRFAIISASTNHHLPRPTTLARYHALDAIVLRTDQDRKSDNDHIVCFFAVEEEPDLNCNYTDLLWGESPELLRPSGAP